VVRYGEDKAGDAGRRGVVPTALSTRNSAGRFLSFLPKNVLQQGQKAPVGDFRLIARTSPDVATMTPGRRGGGGGIRVIYRSDREVCLARDGQDVERCEAMSAFRAGQRRDFPRRPCR